MGQHGVWRHGGYSDDTLVARSIANLITSWEIPVLAMGGSVSCMPDATLLLVGREADFLNGAVLTRPPAYGNAMSTFHKLAEALGDLPRAEIWSAWPLGSTGPQGWSEHEWYTLMYLPQLGDRPPACDGAVVRQVEGVADARVFLDIVAQGFEAHELVSDPPTLREQILDVERFRMFICYLDSKPVATAAAVLDAGVNGVTYVATLPEFRGRGIGRLMTWEATATWPGHPAVLLASSQGRPVYEGLGYIPVSQFAVLTKS